MKENIWVFKKKGFGLIAAIFILILLSSLSAFLMNVTTTQRRDINNDEVRTQLKFLAKSGLEQMLYLASAGSVTGCGTWTSTPAIIAANNDQYLTNSLRFTPTVTATIPCGFDTIVTNSATQYGNMYHQDIYSVHYDSGRPSGYQYFQSIPIAVTASTATADGTTIKFGSPNYLSYTASAKIIVYYTGTSGSSPGCAMSAASTCDASRVNVGAALVLLNSR